MVCVCNAHHHIKEPIKAKNEVFKIHFPHIHLPNLLGAA
jgi:hypothetical protein